MGKRSDYDRNPNDNYATPFKAVLPLKPHLLRYGVRTFADPCAGNDDSDKYLRAHLTKLGFVCNYAGDIVTGQNALELTRDMCRGSDAIITNVPYRYPGDAKRSTRLMRDLIRHFLTLDTQTYLLPSHDFATNQYAAPFLVHCTDIIVIGGVKWIEHSEHNGGMENACWYRVDGRHHGDGRPSTTIA